MLADQLRELIETSLRREATLRQLVADANLNVPDLAESSGLSQATVRSAFAYPRQKTLTAISVEKLARALDTTPEVLSYLRTPSLNLGAFTGRSRWQ